MLIQSVLLFGLTLLISSQKYPNCPGGVPIDIGNTSDLYFERVLDLTGFMDYHDSGSLVSAFEDYGRTGSSSKVDDVVHQNRTFYIIVLVIMGCTTLMLFIVMLRMGDFKLGKREVFDKLKGQGFSSPLSAFFTLVAVILLVSSCLTAYLLAQMTGSLNMTQCRTDVLNEVYLNGGEQQNWDGIIPFSSKLQLVSNLTNNINHSFQTQWSNLNNTLIYAEDNLDKLRLQHSGIVNTYSFAVIGRGDHQTSLTTLVPNLFSNVTQRLTEYLDLLGQALGLFEHLDVVVDNIYSNSNSTVTIVDSMASMLKQGADSYSRDYTAMRSQLSNFFTSTHSLIIMSQIMIGLIIFGGLVAILSLKLIQNSYDFFSLKTYKTIWFTLMLMFCLNLSFLLLFNQTIVYNKGLCHFSQQALSNRTYMEQVFPQTREGGSMHYVLNCYYDHQFNIWTHAQDFIRPAQEYIRLKEEMEISYTPLNIGVYQPALGDLLKQLREYQFGGKGVFSDMDAQLASINRVTSSNYQGQGCFKHKWVYSSSQCPFTQQAAVKPSSVGYLDHPPNYLFYPTLCYALNNYPVNSTPSAHNHSSFSDLYYNYNQQCPYSVHQLTSKTVLFFQLMDSRVNTFNGLIDSFSNLSSFISSTTVQLIDYHNKRRPFLTSSFQSLPQKLTSSYLSSGNSCDIIKHLIKGVYNQFCRNFQAITHQVYLLVVCNICYTILLVIFSLLYAVELRNISKRDVLESYHNMQFMQTNHRITSSESQAELSQSIENKSTNSRESAEKE